MDKPIFKKKDIVALLPAKDEEEAIGQVIDELKKYAGEIVVIDGKSKDKTAKIAKLKGVRVFEGNGEGKGADVRLFLKSEKISPKKAYIMLDADASYPPKYAPELAAKLEEYEVVSGKREGVVRKPRNILHFFGNKIISLTGFALYGKYSDICTGMWGFRGEALKKMELTAKGFELEADIFSEISRLGLAHTQIDIEHPKRIGKEKLKSSDGFRIIYFLIKRRFSRR
jgi:dolichol-phosphate mannosyltransferase